MPRCHQPILRDRKAAASSAHQRAWGAHGRTTHPLWAPSSASRGGSRASSPTVRQAGLGREARSVSVSKRNGLASLAVKGARIKLGKCTRYARAFHNTKRFLGVNCSQLYVPKTSQQSARQSNRRLARAELRKRRKRWPPRVSPPGPRRCFRQCELGLCVDYELVTRQGSRRGQVVPLQRRKYRPEPGTGSRECWQRTTVPPCRNECGQT